MAYRILSGGEATINLSLHSCYGSTALGPAKRNLSSAGNTWVDLSGPLADIIFSSVLIIGIFALTHFIPMSQGLSLGLRIGIAGPSAFWIGGELFYAAVSACKGDNGDFGKIAQRGWIHLLIATAILISLVALCALGVAILL